MVSYNSLSKFRVVSWRKVKKGQQYKLEIQQDCKFLSRYQEQAEKKDYNEIFVTEGKNNHFPPCVQIVVALIDCFSHLLHLCGVILLVHSNQLLSELIE